MVSTLTRAHCIALTACARPVWGLIGITFIISFPISLLLDLLLGKDHGTFYRRAGKHAQLMHIRSLTQRKELKELVKLHAKETNPENATVKKEGLGYDEATVIR